MFQKHQENQMRYNQQENMNLVYARIKKKFREAEYEGKEVDLEEIIQKSYADLEISDAIGFSLKSLHQLCYLADVYGATTLNYYHSDQFFEKHIPEDLFTLYRNEQSWKYLIEMGLSLTNIYFRKRDLIQANHFLKELERVRERLKGFQTEEQQSRFLVLQSLVYNFSGKSDQAIQLLAQNTSNEFPHYLIQAMIQFQQGEYKAVRSLLAQMNHSDKYYIPRFGIEMVMRKNMLEILLFLELQDPDYVESRIQSFLNRFRLELQKNKYANVSEFLSLIRYINQYPEAISSEEFAVKVNASLTWKPSEMEDIFFISFYAWLKCKMTKEPLYETTLKLITLKG
ncbi:MAG: hypothetical protein KDC84_06655 [Crocinitomicaceae bacterium]|nr:hypothetical protein [Crocinitomicaceae bacterium]